MKSFQTLEYFKKNIFVATCFIALLSLCLYQTWLRKKNNLEIQHLNRTISSGQDGKYMFEKLQFSPNVIDSLNSLKKDKLLVLRFLQNDCGECVDSIFSNVSKMSSKIGKENIVVIVDEPNTAAYYKYKRLYQEKIVNFFNFPSGISTVDELGTSYYAIYSKRKKNASLVFLTRPTDFPKETNNYLSIIEDVF